MFSRCMISLFLLCSLLPTAAGAASLFPLADVHVASAAVHFRQKNYKEAMEAASKAQNGGAREFMLAISAQKLGLFEESAFHFAKAADSLPILSDYALYNQARSLSRLSKFAEALPPLLLLLKQAPESPLTRPAQLLYADTLYAAGDFTNAYRAYQKFIERFPLGADSVSVTYYSALCQERLGDVAGASASLRNVRLRYPASTFAAKAETDLLRLQASGFALTPYSTEEKLQYATKLNDLGKYAEATAVLQEIPLSMQPAGTADRYLLKMSQALLKARRYKEAEAQFSALLQKKPSPEISSEATYWLAKTLDKSGRDDEAVKAFITVADSTANPGLADRALFEASFIKQDQNKGPEGIALLKKILLFHPDSSLKESVTWQIGWRSYRSGDLKTAADCFKALLETDGIREKTLYWYGRSLAASGDLPGAQGAFSLLLAEFPFGFYAQTYEKENRAKGTGVPFELTNVCEILPVPPGYERVKALITFGLYDEARRELSLSKKKLPKNSLPGVARLYLEMEDYNGAYNLLNNQAPRTFEKDNSYQWGLCFPLAFREYVARSALTHHIPESLVYAIIKAESGFLPTARSPVGAVGLMQLMPATAAAVAKGKGQFDAEILTNPDVNIRYGIRHLGDLLALYKNDPVLAIAAYNAGAGNVNRWRKSSEGLRMDEFVENIPFAETREYVKKVVAAEGIYSRLYKLGNPLPVSSPPLKDSGGNSIPPPSEKEITTQTVPAPTKEITAQTAPAPTAN